MLLAPSMYEYELAKRFEIASYLSEEDKICLTLPKIYTGEAIVCGGVYIAELSLVRELATDEDCLFICSGKATSPKPSAMRCSVIISESDIISLLNAALCIYEKYQEWEQANNKILTDGNNLEKELLDCAAEVHENMFHILDADFISFALSFTGEPMPEKQEYYTALADGIGRAIPQDDFDDMRISFDTAKLKRKTEYHFLGKIATLDISLHGGDIYLGMLSMIEYNRKFEKQDYAVVQILGSYIEYAMSRESRRLSQSTKHTNLNRVFSDMLMSKHVSKKTITQLFDAVGFGAADSFVVIAVKPRHTGNMQYWEYICNSFANIVEKAIVSGTDNYAILVNTTLNPDKNAWLEKLEHYVTKYEMQACVSDRFSNFQYCELYYNSVAEVLAKLSLNSPAGVYFFADYRVKLALSNSYGKLLPQMMYSDAFRSLIAHDEESDVSYINTLKILLEENMNASQAAKRLYISRNSFLSRLERICRITSIDLYDPDTRFETEYCIRLYEQTKESKK